MTVRLCMPIVVCMSRDFGLTNAAIAKAFSCSDSTIKNKLESAGCKKPSQSQTAEQKLYNVWEEYGYIDKFEIIGKYTKKNEHIPGCKIHRDDKTEAPRDYNLITYVCSAYNKGLTLGSIAEMYGLQVRYVSDMLKANGIATDCGRYNKAITKFKAKATKLEQGKNAVETDLRNWSSKRQRVLEQSLCDITKQASKAGKALDSISKYEPRIATCKHCGKQWVFWPDHRKKWGRVKNPPVYCSNSCNNKHTKKISRERHGVDNVGHRLRRYGTNDKPRDHITLDAVIERDGGQHLFPLIPGGWYITHSVSPLRSLTLRSRSAPRRRRHPSGPRWPRCSPP